MGAAPGERARVRDLRRARRGLRPRTVSAAAPAIGTDAASALRTAAEHTLRANWREGVRRVDGAPYAFTIPSTPRYRHMWHWDSCFHAIAWTLSDPARGRAELRTVLRSGRPDGFLPHTVFWDWPAMWRRAPLYATARMRGSTCTETINPPLLPFAWERVAAASQADAPGFATEALDALAAHMDWLAAERDPDGDGLLTIILPDESGLDDSPKYDPVYGRFAHYLPGYFALVERWRRVRFDCHAIAARTDLHVEDVLVNVAYALSLRALARLSGDARFDERASRTESALIAKCLDPATGLFFDLAGRDERPVRVSTWSSLAPLALTELPEYVRRRLVEEHLAHPRRYGAPAGIPSVSMEEPSFRPGFDRFRTWRGPSWVNAAWLLVPAVRELGYEAHADRIVHGLARAVLNHGFREYYDPRDGRGLAARGFGWSTLIADLVP